MTSISIDRCPAGVRGLYRELQDKGRDFIFPADNLKTASYVGEGPKLRLTLILTAGSGVHGKRPQIMSICQLEFGDGSFERSVYGAEESDNP